MGNQPLSKDSNEKDVGVIFDLQLTFKDHIKKMVAKANSRVGLIKRSFMHLNMKNFKLLYKSLVRPILEYCSSIWSPQFKYLELEIEKVQERATKLVSSIKDLEYPDRLRRLNLTTLKYRRKRTDVLQVFRLIREIDKIDMKQFFTYNMNNTRGNGYKLNKPEGGLNVRDNTFSVRVIDDWNALPPEVVECETINAFKNALEKFWADKPIKYNID